MQIHGDLTRKMSTDMYFTIQQMKHEFTQILILYKAHVNVNLLKRLWQDININEKKK